MKSADKPQADRQQACCHLTLYNYNYQQQASRARPAQNSNQDYARLNKLEQDSG